MYEKYGPCHFSRPFWDEWEFSKKFNITILYLGCIVVDRGQVGGYRKRACDAQNATNGGKRNDFANYFSTIWIPTGKLYFKFFRKLSLKYCVKCCLKMF